jgi:hypothetical protein
VHVRVHVVHVRVQEEGLRTSAARAGKYAASTCTATVVAARKTVKIMHMRPHVFCRARPVSAAALGCFGRNHAWSLVRGAGGRGRGACHVLVVLLLELVELWLERLACRGGRGFVRG